MADQNAKAYEHVVEFHGHSCIGSALGYRVALKAMEWLKANRSEDEEIVCVVENDSCAVDAIQAITGCTFGKGNLKFRDIGKRGYTFYNRNTGAGVRILENYRPKEVPGQADLRKAVFGGTATKSQIESFREMSKSAIDDILKAPDEAILEMKPVSAPPPNKAMLYETLTCASCGEKVMEPRTVKADGGAYCADCADGKVQH
ncbi:MAG TPA: FmdE family protein [bacterium]|nr:FmdE family protein [bacterium]